MKNAHLGVLIATLAAITCLVQPAAAGAQSMDGAWGPLAGTAKAAPAALQLAGALQGAPLHALSAAETGAPDQLAALRAWNASGKRPFQAGFPRRLAEVVDVRLTPEMTSAGTPTPFAGGYLADAGGSLVWGTSVQVAGAQRVRLHLTAVHLPTGSEMLVAAPGGAVHAFGLELLSPAGELWTPSVPGQTLHFEVHVPAAALGAGAGFKLPEAVEVVAGGVPSELPAQQSGSALAPARPSFLGARQSVGAISSPLDAGLFAAQPKDDSCLVDSSCETNANFNNIDTYRHAIASLFFVCSGLSSSSPCNAGDVYLCSGSLLNDTASDATPYMLTANHCIPDQTTATTLESFFDFYTSTCNGTPPNENNDPSVNGATLLATQAGDVTQGSSDFAFLQLPSVPGGRYFLGWNANASALHNNTPLFRLSHPAPNGTPEPQSYTQYTNDPTFSGCTGISLPNFLYEHAVVGSTAGGSSGSPLMMANGQVVGQLGGGCGTDINNDCDTAANDDYDGAFAATYPSVQQYLNASIGPTTPCVPGNPTVLCINNNPNDGRFQITVAWHTSQNGGESGNGNAIALSSLNITEGGIFWFFSASNPEMLIKVINACSLTNSFWIFYSAGTNVGFTVTVSDTTNGKQKFYTNPDLTSAPPVQDTTGLPCS